MRIHVFRSGHGHAARRRSMRLLLLLPALVCACAVSGCGDGNDAGSTAGSRDVASIAGSGSPNAGATIPPDQGVVLRIDMTEEEQQAVYHQYYACLRTQGVKFWRKGTSDPRVEEVPKEQEKDKPKAYRACRSKEPQMDPLLDKTKNPNYADQTRAWMRCMNDRGIRVSGNWDADFFDIDSPDGMSSVEYLNIYGECQTKSYKW